MPAFAGARHRLRPQPDRRLRPRRPRVRLRRAARHASTWTAHRSARPCASSPTRRRSAPTACPACRAQAFECFMDDLCEQPGRRAAPLLCQELLPLGGRLRRPLTPTSPRSATSATEAKLNYGVGICKFTGARGKSGTSDASAELVAYLRRLFADNGVVWQLCRAGQGRSGRRRHGCHVHGQPQHRHH